MLISSHSPQDKEVRGVQTENDMVDASTLEPTNSVSVVDLLRSCLRAAENQVSGGRARHPRQAWLAALFDVSWNGLGLLLAGTKLIALRLILASVVGGMLLGYIGIMERTQPWPVAVLCFALGLAMVLLAPPSRIALLDVTEVGVGKVAAVIHSHGLNGIDLDVLATAIELALQRSGAWLTTLRGAVAIVWGVLFWFICERVLGAEIEPMLRSSAFWTALGGSSLMLVSLGALAAYGAATSAVHLTLRLALLQAKTDVVSSDERID